MFSHLLATPEAPPSAKADATQRFSQLLAAAIASGGLVKLLLTNHVNADDRPERLLVREVLLRGERQLSFLWRYATRDITKNLPVTEGLALIDALLGERFRNAHLLTATAEVQLAYSRKGRPSLRVGSAPGASQAASRDTEEESTRDLDAEPDPELSHDRQKRRPLNLESPFWTDLGITHLVGGKRRLVPTMASKWKQINKFIEVFESALKRAALVDVADTETGRPLKLADFGSGKGYLTFAMYERLKSQGIQTQVLGVELRPDMVALCNLAAQRHGLTGLPGSGPGLRFEQGDVRSHALESLDVMVALHACDIATDHALHLGLRAGAAILLCSPCCHKQLRPQMRVPSTLRPLLQHGIHLGQEAEMVTDSLRAMLLEALGYETQVFEFVALEHTSKNKMILAVKRTGASAAAALARRPELLAQIAEIKRFYGLREQCLETLLVQDGSLA